MATELDPHEQQALATMLIRLLDAWGLEPQQQVQLLGLPAKTRLRALARHKAGEPLPDDGSLFQRAQHLQAIDQALHVTFPNNAAMANYWVTTTNTYFGGRTPLEVMLENGDEGIARVRAHLEYHDEW